MNHDPSRKSFLAKLIGLFGLIGLLPRLIAGGKPGDEAAHNRSMVRIRPDNRAVARRDELE